MEENSNQSDLISRLSDSILIHILSFLPSNLSGRTCILSRRWRHLWEYVPELKLYECADAHIFSFLTHRKSSKLKTFHVSMRHSCPSTQYAIDRALCYCSTQGVEELYLSIPSDSYRNNLRLRGKTLSCWGTSLRVLQLHSCFVSCPNRINLPKIEVLCLSNVWMECGAFHNIITGCPFVESFEISYCAQVSLLRFDLPNLKRLVLNWCNNLEHIHVSVPNLKYFKHHGPVQSLKTFQMEVENLKEAQYTLCGYYWERNKSHVQGSQHLFQAAAQAEHLEVDCYGAQDTFDIFNMNLTYTNVKCLTLKVVTLELLPEIPAIIGQLHGLKNLELSLYFDPPCTPELRKNHYLTSGTPEENELCMQLKDTKSRIDCLRYSLGRIDIQHFEARKTQIEFIKLLLQNAPVLDVICFTDSYGGIARLLKSRQIFTSCAANKNTKFLYQNNFYRHSNVHSW